MIPEPTPGPIEGLKIFPAKLHKDFRGLFTELVSNDILESLKQTDNFTIEQTACSQSTSNVFRGLHLQGKDQAKLIRVIEGSVFDIVLDVRKDSPTFLNYTIFRMSCDKGTIYIPPGVAHGFSSTYSTTIFYYALSKKYDPTKQYVIDVKTVVNDFRQQAVDPPTLMILGIDWPVSARRSPQDKKGLSLEKFLEEYNK